MGLSNSIRNRKIVKRHEQVKSIIADLVKNLSHKTISLQHKLFHPVKLTSMQENIIVYFRVIQIVSKTLFS